MAKKEGLSSAELSARAGAEFRRRQNSKRVKRDFSKGNTSDEKRLGKYFKGK